MEEEEQPVAAAVAAPAEWGVFPALILTFFFFSSRIRHTRFDCDWSSDVCSSDLILTLDRVASGESKGTGWANHPAVRMWAGHEATLAMYAMHICQEWVRRGYRDTMLPWFGDVIERHGDHTLVDPVWWGREDVHASHRAMLLRKDRAHYQVAFGLSDREVQVTLDQQSEYVWPV